MRQTDDVTGSVVIKTILFVLSWCLIGIVLSFPIFAISYNGMAADSSGRVYIGVKTSIHVYDDGVKVGEMGQSVMRGRDFFTIQDDKVHVWTNGASCVMDLDGNIIARPTPYYDTVLTPRQKRNFTAEDGSHYELKYGLVRWNRVIRTYPDGREEVIFHMPLWLHLIKMAVRVYGAVTLWWFLKPEIMRLRKSKP